MAKMKVSDLAKEFGLANKEMIAFLNEKGVDVKVHNSSVDDAACEMARKHFGKAQEPAKEAPVKESNEPKEEAKAAPQKADGMKKRPMQQGAQGEERPKKKKIIIVSGGNGRGPAQGNRPQGNGNGRPDNRNNGQGGSRQQMNNNGYRPLIRSSVKPSQVTDEFTNRNRTQQNQPVNKPQVQPAAPVREEKVEARPVRANTQQAPQNTNNNKPARVENRPAENRERAPRDNNGAPRRGDNNRPSRPMQGGGRNNGGGKPGTSFAAAPVNENKQDTRRGGNDRDKRKKDMRYEEEEAKLSKKAGRFIKPEKKPVEPEETIKVITIPEKLTIKDLAEAMKMQPSAIIKKLFMSGQIVTLNTEVTYEEAENIAIEYEIMCEKEVQVDVIEELLKEEEEDTSKMVKRPPVVCVMGHVDHGKTSLLDKIRETNVTGKEAGGITQAIGAYTVRFNDEKITFLDTPGHEAFTAMRMRGANSTDIAILVVAADDGVMPQTVEAINHAKAAGVEIIVAVNKMDKPNANLDRVKQGMMEYELVATDWGGSTEFVPVSAKTGEGIDELLETVLLTAEIMELKADKKRKARGLVIEAELDKGRGPVATILVQKGTLKVGDFVSAGSCYGKVRAMIDDKGKRVKEATPSTPVEILGLSDVPTAGEVFLAHDSDKTAKSYAETYMAQHKEQMLAETKARMSMEDLFSQIKEGNLKELNLIIKADVQGSVEAVKTSLMKLSNEEVIVKCIHGGVGAINESDVSLAMASGAIIIGFNVKPDAQAKATAEHEHVEVRLYDVIYKAIEDVERAMKGMLDPIYEEKIIGHAEVRQIFHASAVGNIAGSYIMDGEFRRDCKVRITRAGEQIYEGQLKSLKRFKDDVKEVKSGFECGLVFDDFDRMEELDMVEAYIMVEVPRD